MLNCLTYRRRIIGNIFVKVLKVTFLGKTLLIKTFILIGLSLFITTVGRYCEGKRMYNEHAVFLENLLSKGFKTKRLLADQTQEQDLDILSSYLMDNSVTAMLDPTLTDGFSDKEDAKEFLSNDLSDNKFAFTIRLNSSQTPIGQITYTYCNGMLTLSFWVATEYQKNGYASEVILPLTQEIFDTCSDISVLYIVCDYNNICCFNLSEKLCGYINKNNRYSFYKIDKYVSEKYEGRIINFHYWEFMLNKKPGVQAPDTIIENEGNVS